MVIDLYVYVDLLFFTNYLINIFLLFLTGYITKTMINPIKLFLGTLLGTLSIFLLFANINTAIMLILKTIFSFIMIVVSFKSSIKGYIKTTFVFYLLTFCLGGIIFYFENTFGKTTEFTYLTLSLGVMCLVIILTLSVNFLKNRIENRTLYEKVNITHNNTTITLQGYMDSGNTLAEPISGLPVIVVSKKEINSLGKVMTHCIMCHTISGNAIIEVFKPDKLIVGGIEEKAYIGISDKLKNDSFSVLLNTNLRRCKNVS